MNEHNIKRSRGGQLSLKCGDRFGKLTVENYDKKVKRWLCNCDCGEHNFVSPYHLKTGKVKSCGCGHIGPQLHIRRPNNESLKLDLLWVYKNTTKKSKRKFKLSKEQFFELIQNNCHYCGNPPNNTNKKYLKYDKNFRYNGIDRVDNNLGYTNDNCVTCCEICNRAKLKMKLNDFKNWIKRIYDKQFNK